MRETKRACRRPSLAVTREPVKPASKIHSLRVYSPSSSPETSEDRRNQDLDRAAGVAAPRRVEVSLADIAPVIADAVANGRGWLADFADDTVQIDADLYDVLLAYQQMRRFSAA